MYMYKSTTRNSNGHLHTIHSHMLWTVIITDDGAPATKVAFQPKTAFGRTKHILTLRKSRAGGQFAQACLAVSGHAAQPLPLATRLKRHEYYLRLHPCLLQILHTLSECIAQQLGRGRMYSCTPCNVRDIEYYNRPHGKNIHHILGVAQDKCGFQDSGHPHFT